MPLTVENICDLDRMTGYLYLRANNVQKTYLFCHIH